MASKLKKYWEIFVQIQKINLMKRMAYPLSFLINIGTVLLVLVLNFLFIKVTFGYIHNLSGWSYYQVLGIFGCYMIIEGFLWGFMGQLNPINRHISEGTMDGILLKPIDDQFLVSFWRGDYEDLIRIFTGIAALVVAIKNTTGFIWVNLFLFIILLIIGLISLYGFNLMVRCLSFWIIDGSGLWILIERVTGNAQYPIDIYYNKFVRGFFTFIIPLAFVATVPAKILTNVSIDWKLVLISFGMGVVFFFGSRAFWKFSLKHYSSASS